MWSRGSGRRPPRPPRGSGGRPGVPRIDPRRLQARVVQAPAAEDGRVAPVWRRLRRHVKALWRWVVVRTLRGWAHRLWGRAERPEPPTQPGAVRQFPHGR